MRVVAIRLWNVLHDSTRNKRMQNSANIRTTKFSNLNANQDRFVDILNIAAMGVEVNREWSGQTFGRTFRNS